MTSPLHRHSGRRLRAATFAAAIVAAITLAPAASFADDIEGPDGPSVIDGTPNDDTITGDQNDVTGAGPVAQVDGSDDTINGGAGQDDILGDGAAQNAPVAIVIGGDDTINGGNDDDQIVGDGLASGFLGGFVQGGDDTIHGGNGNDDLMGDGFASGGLGALIEGGDDILYGDAGDDELYGDGFTDSFLGLDGVVGGDDELYGGLGADYLEGQGGNDLLCGLGDGLENTEADELWGGEGSDLACAVNDHAVVSAGEETLIHLAANDEQLDDEGNEDGGLVYALGAISAGIQAIIDAATGDLTLTAECSGTVDYTVSRDDVESSELMTSATLTVDVEDEAAACHPVVVVPEVDEPADVAAAGTAVLPDTGASGGLNAIGASGLGLLVGGVAVLTAASRRKVTITA